MKKLTKVNIVIWFNNVFFLVGIVFLFIALWSNGWNIIRFTLTGVLLMSISLISHKPLEEIKISEKRSDGAF